MTRWTQSRRPLPAGTPLAVGLLLAELTGPARAVLIFDPSDDDYGYYGPGYDMNSYGYVW